MRIDAHHHLWDLSVRPQPWTDGFPALQRSFSVDDLAPILDAAGIDLTIVVQTAPAIDETVELLTEAVSHPLIAGVVGWVDLESRDVADQLARFSAEKGGERLVGVRHQVEAEPDFQWLERLPVNRALTDVSEAGLVFDLLVRHVQIPSAIAVARQHPELRFVLDHAAKPRIAKHELEPWSGLLQSLAALPNVAVKLSGLTTEAADGWSARDLEPYVDFVLTTFGSTRVMFGSDWPVCLVAGSYSEMDDAIAGLTNELSSDEQADVYWRTAATWYGLDGAQLGWRPDSAAAAR